MIGWYLLGTVVCVYFIYRLTIEVKLDPIVLPFCYTINMLAWFVMLLYYMISAGRAILMLWFP